MTAVARPHAHPGAYRLPAELLWRLTVDQYHAMIAAGILTEDDPVELLAGWLISKMPKNPGHSLSTELTRKALSDLVPGGWHVRSQEPITLADSEPEPDIAIASGVPRDYRDRHPDPQDLALVVEVSDATFERDSTLKRYLYASAGIPAYWIVNLSEKRVEEYRRPGEADQGPDYAEHRSFGVSDSVALVIDGVEAGAIPVRDLLP